MFIIYSVSQWLRSQVSIRAAWPTTRFASAPAKVQGWWCQSLSNPLAGNKWNKTGLLKCLDLLFEALKKDHRSLWKWPFYAFPTFFFVLPFASSEPTAFLQTLLHGPELFIQWDPTLTGPRNGWNKADKHLSEATKCLQIERSGRTQAHNAK